MFTGIVEATGRVVDVTPSAGGARIRVATDLAADLQPGDSLAVDGVCLTVTARDGGDVHADIGPETARVTTLGGLTAGRLVNLERPMALNGRLGGHMVLGHVDGIGRIAGIRAEDASWWLTVRFPGPLAPYFIRKGSVAVDGVSLTVATLGADTFDVQIIPFTWEHTTFHARRTGDAVNLECDMIGKYVVRALELGGGRDPRG